MPGELGGELLNDWKVDSDRGLIKSTAAGWMDENSEANANQKVKDIF